MNDHGTVSNLTHSPAVAPGKHNCKSFPDNAQVGTVPPTHTCANANSPETHGLTDKNGHFGPVGAAVAEVTPQVVEQEPASDNGDYGNLLKRRKVIALSRMRTYHARNGKVRQRDKARARKAELVKLKGGKCLDCGIKGHPAIYHFDHRDPATKTLNISHNLACRGLPAILAELEKCDLVCANCHALRTYGNPAVALKLRHGHAAAKAAGRR